MKILEKCVLSSQRLFLGALAMFSMAPLLATTNAIADGPRTRVIEATAATGMNRLFGEPIAVFPDAVGAFGFTTIGAFNPDGDRPIPLTSDMPDSTLIVNFLDVAFLEFFFGQAGDPLDFATVNVPMRQLPVASDASGVNHRTLPGILEAGQMDLSQAEPADPITLGDWLKARGTLKIDCPVDGYPSVHIRMSGLLSNRFYTFLEWFRPGPASPFVVVPGIFGGIPGTVTSDEGGNAEYHAVLNACPPLSADEIDHPAVGLVVVLQTDHQSNGGTPATPLHPLKRRFPGETASVQLFFPFIGERLVGPSSTLAEKKDVDCERVELLAGDLQIQPPFSPAIGPANFIIDGEPALAEATVTFLGPPAEQDDGTLTFSATIRYDFGQIDVLNAMAHGVLSPTESPGVFRNNARIRYIGGTGIYESAFGQFSTHGVLSFADLTVLMQGKGKICGRGDD